MTRPDLHTHSTFSDGVLSPSLLVEKAVSMGVTVMAVTDHDTFEGCDSLWDAALPIPVIPGVELSLRDMTGLHLLCYGLTSAPVLRGRVAELARMRVGRAEAMVRRLRDMGIALDWERITAACRGTVGRAHVARALVAEGYSATMQEAFDRYLGEGKPAYVPGERMSMAEALPLLRGEGFVPVLAHPALLNKDDMTLRQLLEAWATRGLMGVEVYHPSLMGREAALERMARSMGLLVTGGSDYHQDGDSHGQMGATAEGWQRVEEDMTALWNALRTGEEKNSGRYEK